MQTEVDSLILWLLQGCLGVSVLKGEPAASRHQNMVLAQQSAMQILQYGGTLLSYWRLKLTECRDIFKVVITTMDIY